MESLYVYGGLRCFVFHTAARRKTFARYMLQGFVSRSFFLVCPILKVCALPSSE